MAAKVRDALAGPLPAAVARMRLYLANPATHAILFKPIKSNIAEAHGQARHFFCYPGQVPKECMLSLWRLLISREIISASCLMSGQLKISEGSSFHSKCAHSQNSIHASRGDMQGACCVLAASARPDADSTCVQVATLLEAEYPPGEAQRAGLTPPGELAALLDALC